MKPISSNEVLSIYDGLKSNAVENAKQGHDLRALNFIKAAAFWAYNFNFIYSDSVVEDLLKDIAGRNIPPKEVVTADENRCVYLDSWCLPNRGLNHQYLRAMMARGMEILYITTSGRLEEGKGLVDELRNYEKAEIFSFQDIQVTEIKKAEIIRDKIIGFKAKSVFLQIFPWELTALMACSCVDGVTVYNINLTDHAFWLGASFLNYNFEFRPYGITVSQEKRGIKPEQQLVLPYYPITPVINEFKGFPKLPQDAVKVFTGGALYKMLGGEDIFFRIMDSILEITPKVYILVAGFERIGIFDEKCSRMKHGDRVVQIGVRSDIDAVFDHIDIYLGTYPTSGGLMNQYAAKHGRPIVAYCEKGDAENRIEELVNHYQSSFKTYSNFPDLIDYATSLITDKSFRIQEGRILQDGLMTEGSFQQEFDSIFVTHKSPFSYSKEEIDYEAFFKRYIDLENSNGFDASKELVRILKLDIFKTDCNVIRSSVLLVKLIRETLLSRIKMTLKN